MRPRAADRCLRASLGFGLLASLIGLAQEPPTSTGAPTVLWVSPEGHDDNPGSRDRPLQTIEAARRAVLNHPALRRRPMTVQMTSGTYYLDSTIVFTPADSGAANAPVTYAAAPGAEPVISGGHPLRLDWQPHGEGIVRAKLPPGPALDQFFVNGTRQPMARYPNADANAQYFQGFAADCTAPERVATWANPAGGYLHAMHVSLWGDMHWRIEGKRGDNTLELVGGWQNNRQMGAHQTYRFVEHVFEELDAPGEWYHDAKAGWLYFRPPPDVDPRRAKAEGAGLPQLLAFRGTAASPVRHIRIRGLTFRHAARTFMENAEPLARSDWTTSRSGALLFQGAEDCTVENCLIDQPGGNGIFADGYNRRLRITGTHITDAGASSISFVGHPTALRSPLFEYHQTQTLAEMDPTPGPKDEAFPADCLVQDCLLVRNGRVEKQTAGVNIAMAESITVRHCSVYDCPRAGINICDGAFGGHLIEFNDVFDTVKETGDHGSFNSWGRDRFWHPDRAVTAQWVLQHPEMARWDCRQPIVIRNNRWRCDHGWDIDLDDGSSHYVLANNLCLAGGIKLREGYFRTVTNNITVNWTFCPHVWYPESHSAFARNIVWHDLYRPAGMQATDQPDRMDFNLVHQAGADPRPASGLQRFGGDRHSLVADARFIDPLAGDYRVHSDSPAIRLGFQNFPMDQFGVQSPELRRLARSPPLPGSLEAASIRSGGWDRPYTSPEVATWMGAHLKTLVNPEERSAVGLGPNPGVLVTQVEPASPADTVGLRALDVILEIEGTEVTDVAALGSRLRQQTAPSPTAITVWRNQAVKRLQFTLPQPINPGSPNPSPSP